MSAAAGHPPGIEVPDIECPVVHPSAEEFSHSQGYLRHLERTAHHSAIEPSESGSVSGTSGSSSGKNATPDVAESVVSDLTEGAESKDEGTGGRLHRSGTGKASLGLLLKAWRTLVEVEWRENEKDSGDSIVRATIPGWPAEVPWPARVLQPVTQEQREEAALFPEKMFVVWYGTRQEWSFVDKDSCAPFVPGESEPGAAWLLSAVERKQFWVAEAQAAQDLEQLQEHHKEHGPGDPAAGAARTEALAGAMLQLRSGVEIGGAWVSETRRKYKRVFPSERRIKVCEFQHATPASKPPAPEEHADPADGLPRKRRGQPLPAALCCPAVPHEPGGASKKLGAGQGGSPTRPMGIKPRARKSQTPEASTAGMTPPRRKGQAGVGDRAGRGAAPSIAEGPGMSDLERQSKRRSGGGAGSFARSVRNVAASYTDFDAALKRALAQSLKER